jgi:hypothetical protein
MCPSLYKKWTCGLSGPDSHWDTCSTVHGGTKRMQRVDDVRKHELRA